MSLFIFYLVLVELVIVSWIDIKTKKISNHWIWVNFIIGLSVHIFLTDYYQFNWEVLIFPVGWIIVGFFLYLLGIMGAGDSKFIASLYFIIPLGLHLIFLEKLISGSMLVAIILLTFTIVRNFSTLRAYAFSSYWKGILEKVKSKFSYAPVILLAWVLLGVSQWK